MWQGTWDPGVRLSFCDVTLHSKSGGFESQSERTDSMMAGHFCLANDGLCSRIKASHVTGEGLADRD